MVAHEVRRCSSIGDPLLGVSIGLLLGELVGHRVCLLVDLGESMGATAEIKLLLLRRGVSIVSSLEKERRLFFGARL